MTLVTIWPSAVGITRNQRGQISLFFSASLIVLITIIAFVINIGLFVKAKINLQNSVDAAAYAGASVQARQLTRIAYLNWEMRNVFKEWMFKYYVLGNVTTEGVKNPSGSVMDFKMKSDLINTSLTDPYNWPSVCIHLAVGSGGGTTNICSRYSVPGLPEFGGYSMPGAEEASRAFIDALIDSKLADCNTRTKMNMYVTTAWAYNVMGGDPNNNMTGFGPAILADRQGAWPSAVELAIRIRNLEYVVNRPAVTEGVCNGGSTELTNCSRQITEFTSDNVLGNERLIKAFYAGYRNLSTANDELKETFTIRELAPRIPNIANNQYNASYLFIPANKVQQAKKQYLDLKAMSVNYATFYSSFIGSASDASSGTCDVTKLGLPVPGYPLGFYKNPDVLTYYAVKGEAEFVGMFNPFGKTVKLTAYAAAKPFGGRIGPMLFNTKENTVLSRTTANNYRSAPYITGVDLSTLPDKQNPGQNLPAGSYAPGAPLPLSEFWLADKGQPVGFFGASSGSADLRFGIPNLVYDFPRQKSSYSSLSNPIYQIVVGEDDSIQPIGLFNVDQFKAFKENLDAGTTLDPIQMKEAVLRARGPTEYDSFNYLIPSPQKINQTLGIDSFGFIASDPEQLSSGGDLYKQDIYAPLFSQEQEDVLYTNSTDVVAVIKEYMEAQKPAIDKYREALNNAAKTVFRMKNNTANNADPLPYKRAANGISDIGFLTLSDSQVNALDSKTERPATCTSMLGQFLAFYLGPDGVGDNTGCPSPLFDNLAQYFNSTGSDQKYDPTYYRMEFVWRNKMPPSQLFTAYMPGPMTGIANDGTYNSPFGGTGETMRRNSYSTKFVTLDSIKPSGHYQSTSFPMVSEGDIVTNSGQAEVNQNSFANALEDPNLPVQINH